MCKNGAALGERARGGGTILSNLPRGANKSSVDRGFGITSGYSNEISKII